MRDVHFRIQSRLSLMKALTNGKRIGTIANMECGIKKRSGKKYADLGSECPQGGSLYTGRAA